MKSLLSLIESNQIKTVNVGFPDHYGRLCGKKIEAEFFRDNVHKEGTHACNYLLGCDIVHNTPEEVASWQSGYGDYHLVCDDSSVRNYWLDGQALVLCDLMDTQHQLVPFAPRSMLKNICSEMEEQGLHVKCASELEMYYFQKNY